MGSVRSKQLNDSVTEAGVIVRRWFTNRLNKVLRIVYLLSWCLFALIGGLYLQYLNWLRWATSAMSTFFQTNSKERCFDCEGSAVWEGPTAGSTLLKNVMKGFEEILHCWWALKKPKTSSLRQQRLQQKEADCKVSSLLRFTSEVS